MSRTYLFVFSWLFVFVAQAEVPALDGVDVYGTQAFDGAFVRAQFANELAALAEASAANDPVANTQAKERFKEALLRRGDFAFVEATLISYFGQPVKRYLTVDVVERRDREQRMPFFATPQGKIPDPEGLLTLWAEYQPKMLKVFTSGTVGTAPCEVLHCVVPFKPYPELLPYLSLFNDKVRRNEPELYKIVTQESSAVSRGNAIFLLAHSTDANRLLQALGRAIYDPSSYVRNNAMRVMAYIAERQPELAYPIEDLVRAMDFPTATDRNKGAFTLTELVKSQRHREKIAALVIPNALRMLRLEQPINHEPALELLRAISGESIAARDYAAWDRWYAAHSKQGVTETK